MWVWFVYNLVYKTFPRNGTPLPLDVRTAFCPLSCNPESYECRRPTRAYYLRPMS
jgi:hypothetical protein